MNKDLKVRLVFKRGGDIIYRYYTIDQVLEGDALAWMKENGFSRSDCIGINEYIGLSDEHGRDIYNGDIIKNMIHDTMGRQMVIFKHGNHGVCPIDNDGVINYKKFKKVNVGVFFVDSEIVDNYYTVDRNEKIICEECGNLEDSYESAWPWLCVACGAGEDQDKWEREVSEELNRYNERQGTNLDYNDFCDMCNSRLIKIEDLEGYNHLKKAFNC